MIFPIVGVMEGEFMFISPITPKKMVLWGRKTWIPPPQHHMWWWKQLQIAVREFFQISIFKNHSKTPILVWHASNNNDFPQRWYHGGGEFIFFSPITPKKMETWFHLPTPHRVVRWLGETTTDRDQRIHPDSSHSLILVVYFNLSWSGGLQLEMIFRTYQRAFRGEEKYFSHQCRSTVLIPTLSVRMDWNTLVSESGWYWYCVGVRDWYC